MARGPSDAPPHTLCPQWGSGRALSRALRQEHWSRGLGLWVKMLGFWSGPAAAREVTGRRVDRVQEGTLSRARGRAQGQLSAGEGGGMVMGLARAGRAKRTGSQCPRSQLLAQAQLAVERRMEWMPAVWESFSPLILTSPPMSSPHPLCSQS